MARAAMVFTQNVPIVNKAGEFQLKLTPEMGPRSRLIAYAVRPDNKEILVDAVDLDVDGFMTNIPRVTTKSDVVPGEQTSIRVKADKNSYVALVAVDQSVLLLKNSSDISGKDLKNPVVRKFSS